MHRMLTSAGRVARQLQDWSQLWNSYLPPLDSQLWETTGGELGAGGLPNLIQPHGSIRARPSYKGQCLLFSSTNKGSAKSVL
jgi:hypothetical protein